MKRVFCFSLSATISWTAWNQVPRYAPASLHHLVNTLSSTHCNVFSYSMNQARLGKAKVFSAGVSGENPYLLKDLAVYKMAVSLPTEYGGFGFNAGYFRSGALNETQLGLAYGRHLGSKLSLGGQFNYYTLNLKEYGRGSSVNFEMGTAFQISDRFMTTFHVYNPLGSSIKSNENERLPAIFSMGLGYDASDQFFIGVAVQKTESQPVNIVAGMEYHFAGSLFARSGISSGNSSAYFSAGYQLKSMRIEVTATRHQFLGFSAGMVLIYINHKK